MENPFELINQRLDKIEQLLSEIKKNQESGKYNLKEYPEIMNTECLAEYLSASKSRIYKLTNERAIPYYKNGKNAYFKKTEVDEWITKGRVKTHDELMKEVDAILAASNKRRK
ncbi:MAG: helix-turn-helix domain-containing protein [Chitinophagales bacterium]